MLKFKQWLVESAEIFSACVILLNRDRVLILQRGKNAPWMPGKWNLPGGGGDQGETPAQTASREVVEESGIVPKNLRLLKMIDDSEMGHIYFFIGEAVGNVKLNYESKDAKWVSLQEIDKFDFVPYVKEMLRSALTQRNSHDNQIPGFNSRPLRRNTGQEPS